MPIAFHQCNHCSHNFQHSAASNTTVEWHGVAKADVAARVSKSGLCVTRNRWAAISHCFEDGDPLIENNLTEQAVLPIAISIKSFLSVGSFATGQELIK